MLRFLLNTSMTTITAIRTITVMIDDNFFMIFEILLPPGVLADFPALHCLYYLLLFLMFMCAGLPDEFPDSAAGLKQLDVSLHEVVERVCIAHLCLHKRGV